MAFWTHKSTRNNELQPKLKDRFLVIMGGEITDPEATDLAFGTPFSHRIMFTVKSVDKPSVSIETKDFKLINHKFKYPGLVTWNPIKITMVDMAGQPFFLEGVRYDHGIPPRPEGSNTSYLDSRIKWDKEFFESFGSPNFENTGAALAFLLRGAGYDTPHYSPPTGASKNTTISKEMFQNMMQNLTIQQLAFTPSPAQALGPDEVVSSGKITAVEQWTLKNPVIKSISWGSLSYADEGLVEYDIEIDYDFAEVSFNAATAGYIITN